MTQEQLNIRPAPDRWPLWATIGHAACQRVFSLCDFGASIVQRVFAHDISHIAELNEALSSMGLAQVDLWD